MSYYTAHEHGIYQVRLPMGAAFWMNSYLIPDGDRYSIIDPGFYTDDIISIWESVSKELGFSLQQINKIIVTHHHPDHYGLSGWLQQQSGAPVYVSELADQQIKALWGGDRPLLTHFLETFRKNGVPQELYDGLEGQLVDNLSQVLPHATTTIVHEGDVLTVGVLQLELIHIPGHAAGHLALYNAEHQLIFVGDEVMPDSLPDTCYVSDEYDSNPIQSYIDSLSKLKRYEVSKAFPGHHQPFTNFSERLIELEQLNEERQQKVLAQFTEDKWITAYDAYYGVFEPLAALLQKRFHYTETLSRVRYAWKLGQIEMKEEAGVLRYSKLT